MRQYLAHVVLLCIVFMTGCAPVVEVTKIGHEYVQNSYSRQFWWPNWQRVTYCWQLKDGYCPKDDTRVETHTQIAMSARGQEAAVGMVKNAPFALMGFSFPRNRFSQTFESNGINQAYISTLNTPAGQFPWAK